MRILAIGNHKGGVAKTTTVATVGQILARRGRRVLMVDTCLLYTSDAADE